MKDARKGRAPRAVSFGLTAFALLSLFTVTGPVAHALDSCPTKASAYKHSAPVISRPNQGDFKMYYNLNDDSSHPWCVFVQVRDTTTLAADCFDGMYDWANPVGHYDSRQFITCQQGTWKSISFTDNEDSKQNITGIQTLLSCSRTGSVFGSFNNCVSVIGGASVDDGTQFPKSPTSTNAWRGDFFTWSATGKQQCYDEGAASSCSW